MSATRDPRTTPPSGLRPTLPTWAIVTPDRLEHIVRVAGLVAQWAEDMGVGDNERNRWLRAVWLHDALRDAPADELEKWAPSAPGTSEFKHGPAAAARAKAEGETDRGVLDAVRYHSMGLVEWDMVGRALYCADYLEPGRAYHGPELAALSARFPTDSRNVMRDVARLRISHAVRRGWSLPDPTVRFWNSLVLPAAG